MFMTICLKSPEHGLGINMGNQRPEGTEGSAIKIHWIKRPFWYSFLCEKLLVYENVGHVSGKM